jgi:TolB protein
MIERVSLPNCPALSRRRLITVGAGAAVGVLAGLSPQRAAAVLKLDVTQGTIQPVPIAIPDFIAGAI